MSTDLQALDKKLSFVPKLWLDLLPAVGDRGPRFDPRCWIVLWFELGKTRAYFGVSAWPTKEVGLRQKVVERLVSDPKEIGLRSPLKTRSDQRSRLGSVSIGRWSEQNGPDEETVVAAARKKLDELATRLASVSDALRPIIMEWEQSRTVGKAN